MKIYEAVESALLASKGPDSFLTGYTKDGTEHTEHIPAFEAQSRYVAIEAIANTLGLKSEYLFEQYNEQKRIVEGSAG